MKFSMENAWYWAPRLLGLGMTLFVGMFALDAFENGLNNLKAFGDFALHLIPAMVLLGAVLIGWRYDGIGAFLFAVLGIAYILITRFQGPLTWYLFIAGPLFLISILFWKTSVRMKKEAENPE